MLDKVNILLTAASPYRVLPDLGYKLHWAGSICVAHNPQDPTQHYYIGDLDIIPRENTCKFQGGNSVDFFRHATGQTTRASVRNLISEYCDPDKGYVDAKVQLAEDLLARAIDDIFLINRKLLINNIVDDSRAYNVGQGFLRQYGMDPKQASRLVSLKTGAELRQYALRLKSPGLRNKLQNLVDSHCYMVVPYLASHYSPVHLEFINTTTGDTDTSLSVLPYRFGFFGMRSVIPSHLPTTFARDYQEVLSQYTTFCKHGELGGGLVSVKEFQLHLDSGPRLENTILPTKKDPSLEEIVTMFPFTNNLRINTTSDVFGIPYGQCLDARAYIRQKFLIAASHQPDKYLLGFMEQVREDKILHEECMEVLKLKSRYGTLLRIKEALDVGPTVEIGSHLLIRTKDGYVATKDDKNILVTNFSIKINRVILFKETGDAYYYGVLHMGSQNYDFTIDKADSQNLDKIVNAATAAVTSDEEAEVTKIPMVLHPKFAKSIPQVIANEIFNISAEVGVHTLGWSPSRKQFTAPSWTASDVRVLHDPKILHPHAKNMSVFATYDEQVNDKPDINNPTFNTLMALASSLFCRAYLHLRTPIVKVDNSTNTKKLALAVFAGLGQKDVLRFNPNARSKAATRNAFSEFSGYPLLGSCFNEDALKDLEVPIMLLSEAGTRMPKEADSDDMVNFSKWYFPLLSYILCHSKGTWFEQKPATLHGMLAEGEVIMKRVLGTQEVPTVELHDHQYLFQLLSEAESVPAKFDFEEQKILLLTSASSVSGNNLVIELLAAGCIATVYGPSDDVVVHASDLQPLLEEFYGVAPELEPVSIKPQVPIISEHAQNQ